ncbi:unnamed protein product [Meganyctiphanes norvegica]|uniref:Caspase n=1 Tax=Meganyctiphanes norvegica TaxID=48144 RepID=A0AAV2Q4Z6_MEGNR
MSRLCAAVSKGDQRGVQLALQGGEDPNTTMPWTFPEGLGGKIDKVPVLVVAVDLNNIHMVNILLKAKVNIEFKGDFRVTALEIAANEGYANITEQLLNHGADVNAKDSIIGTLPIHFAAFNGSVQIMEMLHARGSPIDPSSNNGQTPLHCAASCGHKSAIQWLVAHNADVLAVSNDGMSAAKNAESKGHKEVAEWLRPYEANVAARASRLTLQETNTASGQVRQHNKKLYILNYIEFKNQTSTVFGSTTIGALSIDRRDGADVDSQNLMSTFRQLGYDVNLHENKTANQTNLILDYIQQNQNLGFLLLIILSHGEDDDTFFTSDGCQYSLKSIQQRFTDSGCPQLRGKSKILLANFCRGTNIEDILPSPSYQNRDFNLTDATPGRSETPHHMITVYASHEGFAARRDINKGTLFVHNLCEVLRKQLSQQPIQDTFNQVFERIQMSGGQTPEMKVSIPFPNFQF